MEVLLVLMVVTEAGFFPAALAVCGDWYVLLYSQAGNMS
jgi:hypothetical protein